MNAELPPFKNGEHNYESVSIIDRVITPLIHCFPKEGEPTIITLATWAMAIAYAPPLAPARYDWLSATEWANEPVIAPQPYINMILHQPCTISRGMPSNSWNIRLTIRCKYLKDKKRIELH